MNPTLVLATLLLSFCNLCSAHEDTRLPVSADGTLTGLPAKYAPAKLEVQFEGVGTERRISSFRLQIGKHSALVPSCVAGLLATRSTKEIDVLASWYHSRSILPPYIGVVFPDPGFDKKAWAKSGYTFLFNLDTGKLIKMEVHIVRDKGRSMQGLPIDVRALCTKAELAQLL